MATLFFINVPGQMTDTDFGIGEYFTGSFTLTVQPPDSVGLIDSGTGNSITIRVALPLPANTNDAVVTSLDVRSPHGAQLMWWIGMGPKVGQLVSLGPNKQLAAYMQDADFVFGSQFTDVLKGFAGADEVRGYSGHDVLDGGTGADLLVGGGGANTYVVDNPGDVIQEDATFVQPRPIDVLRVSADVATGLERQIDDPTISADGRFAAHVETYGPPIWPFETRNRDVVVTDLLTGQTERYALQAGQSINQGGMPALSEDGRFLMFKDHYDVYRVDRETGVRVVVSAAPGNATSSFPNINVDPSVSADGRYVVYTDQGVTSWAGDDDAPGFPNDDIVLRDLSGGHQVLSVLPGGPHFSGESQHAQITPDGRFVVFDSTVGLTGGANGSSDVYLFDRQTSTMELVSQAASGVPANMNFANASISPDGRYVVFQSVTDEIGTPVTDHVYLKDRQTGTVVRVSELSDGTGGNGDSSNPGVSADGRFVVFENVATNFTHLDGSPNDVFLRDMSTGEIVKLSNGPQTRQEGTTGYEATMSADGSVIVFWSFAPFTEDDDNQKTDVFAVINPFLQPAPEYRDTVRASIDYTLQDDMEDLVLTGSAALRGYGNAFDNILVGNVGANVLNGLGGADTMAGGRGNDTFVVTEAGDAVIESAGEGDDLVLAWRNYSLPAFVERLTLEGTGNFNGTGNELGNTLQGNDGTNVLVGAQGDDIYIVGAGDTVVEVAGEGNDTIRTEVDFSLPENVEQLILTSDTGSHIKGNIGRNVLTGGTGHDVLDGGRGADDLVGGRGDDGYKVDNALDQVSEAAGQGVDTLVSTIAFVLPTNVENLILAQHAGNATGTGNGADNVLEGNSRGNVLDGGAGNDILKGHGGDDVLIGGAGDDRVSGGAGRDTLYGDAGADRFVFDSTISGLVNIDLIVDFVRGVDKMELASAIFTDVGAAGVLSADRFVGGAGAVALDALDRIVHDSATGMLYYDADGGGVQGMVAFAQISHGLVLAASDVVVGA